MFEFFRADDWLFLYRDGEIIYAGRSTNFDENSMLNLLNIDWTDQYIEGEDRERYTRDFGDWRNPPKTSIELREWLESRWTEGL